MYANGKGIGSKISVRDMLDDGIPVVDLNSGSNDSSGDNSNKEDNDGCDCGCEDNVVEFGYSSSGTIAPDDSEDNEDNVVEF